MIAALLPWARPTAAAVVRDHGAEVLRRLRRIFGPAADVDDVYQSVFVEVIRSLPSYAGRAHLSAWIRRITYNVAYQEMRLRYRRPELLPLDEAVEPTAPPPEGALESREALRAFHAALGVLEPSQRLAVVLHDVEGLKLREIAVATGRPLSTVASQLAAGRARVAALLGGQAARRDGWGRREEAES